MTQKKRTFYQLFGIKGVFMKQINVPVKLLENHHLVSDFYLATFEYKGIVPEPGQFVNLDVSPHFLRRPFAVFDYGPDYLQVLYKVVGKGTQDMTRWPVGYQTQMLSPLGKSFPVSNQRSILIGGGTGIASLFYLSRKLPGETFILLGVNNREEARAFSNLFEKTNTSVLLSTLDGSHGFRGNAIQAAEELLKDKSDYTVYACGPHGMLEALHRSIHAHKRIRPEETWVSLEARMGCGFGVCLGCAVEKKDSADFFYVCKDGPVFRMDELKWESNETAQ
jgi:dihydroorotate dehydrogenase electron transfer subunit